MAYETKVILQGISQHCLRVKTSKQVYNIVRKMAQVEGLSLPSFEDAKAEVEQEDAESED
jgi:hypothetical protein